MPAAWASAEAWLWAAYTGERASELVFRPPSRGPIPLRRALLMSLTLPEASLPNPVSIQCQQIHLGIQSLSLQKLPCFKCCLQSQGRTSMKSTGDLPCPFVVPTESRRTFLLLFLCSEFFLCSCSSCRCRPFPRKALSWGSSWSLSVAPCPSVSLSIWSFHLQTKPQGKGREMNNY